jgi:hypothetical protein
MVSVAQRLALLMMPLDFVFADGLEDYLPGISFSSPLRVKVISAKPVGLGVPIG